MKVGLFFGSFNPIHIGHMMVAIRAQEQFDLDEIWFVVSPQNPFKEEKDLLDFTFRKQMVIECCEYINREGEEKRIFFPSDIEEFLPKPSYTSRTLKHLRELHPAWDFSIIMGQDCLEHINGWKDNDYITENFEILYYPRTNKYDKDESKLRFFVSALGKTNIKRIDAPLSDVSSTEIRKRISEHKTIKFMVSDAVEKYIMKNGFYL